MRAKRVVWCALIAVTALLVLGSATVAAGSSVQSPQVTAAKAKVGVKYTVRKFVRSGNRLVAYGTATARYIPVSGAPTVTRKPFKATVTVRGRHFAAVQTICPVLELTLGPLDLSLLGAIVHLDKVHLVISADSEGGVLGKLLCNLAKQGKLGAQTQQLNWSLQKSGLATNGTALTVSVGRDASSQGQVARGARLFLPNSDQLCGADIALLTLDNDVKGVTPSKVRFTPLGVGHVTTAVARASRPGTPDDHRRFRGRRARKPPLLTRGRRDRLTPRRGTARSAGRPSPAQSTTCSGNTAPSAKRSRR